MNTPNLPVTAADFLKRIEKHQPRINALKGRHVSDVVDAEGHQYVDLVLEGGGTLGIALLGYIHVLEQVGLRFIGIGGTSAGAVSAIALAAAGLPAEARMGRLLDVLANMPMASFIDGKDKHDDDARDLLDAWMGDRSFLVKISKTWQVIDNFREIHALNRGDAFWNWVDKDLLRPFNQGKQMTVADLRSKMTTLPKLALHPDASRTDLTPADTRVCLDATGKCTEVVVDPSKDLLCVVAADISTETKVEWPRMADLYWEDPGQALLADLARASMSIPGFFATFQRPPLPQPLAKARWEKAFPYRIKESFEGNFLPSRHHFVDGGVLSNFPIKAFHKPHVVPLRPTLGVKLQWDEYSHEIKGLTDVVKQSFNTARHALDTDFITDNPDFSRLVAFIDTQSIHWLDFNMGAETKLSLFEMGALSAIDFLQRFDWPGYKAVRKTLAPLMLPPQA